jgi:hypothetical protein
MNLQLIHQLQYAQLTTPMSRKSRELTRKSLDSRRSESIDGALRRSALESWHKAAAITKQALHDEDASDSDEYEILSSDPLERQKQLEERLAERKEREHNARAMSLQYFLEMVDLKHRYGSNLRAYHQEWQKSTSDENFFFWLDHGEGKELDLKICPRERLEVERVRYLSKAERLNYLVEIDSEGRLCWEKNGERIDTTIKYRDSVNGISQTLMWCY